MISNKRLQVFISSTYSDLKEERQAAVQAILSAGHMPAGMELFAAGDQTQLEVIKNWIEQSDVYLLILGGRYGSVEPNSGKSYIQLEYEYAVEKGKPVFSIVLEEESEEERIKLMGSVVIEKENYPKYIDFKKHVKSRMVKFWKDSKDIKLAIYETLNDFSKRYNLIGWIPGNQQADTSKLTAQLIRVGQENSALNATITQQYKENDDLKAKILEIEKATKTISLKKMYAKSRGFVQKATIGGLEVSLQVGEYSDGTLGEFHISIPRESEMVRALVDSFAMAVSLGLQYGVPLEEFVDKFIFLKFKPDGVVDHPNVKSATSILDLVFRILGYEYLGRTDLVQVLDMPMVMNTGADDWDEVPSNPLDYSNPDVSSSMVSPKVGDEDNETEQK